jgi:hypothetical protein
MASTDMPPAIGNPFEWSVTAIRDQPRRRAPSASSAIVSTPSLQVECI